MRHFIVLGCSLVFCFLIIACQGSSQEEQTNKEEDLAAELENQLKEPPKLNVKSGDQLINAIIGTTSWSFRNADGTFQNYEAHAGPSIELIQYQSQKLTVAPSTEMRLDFDNQPKHYIVRVLDLEEVIIDRPKGETIVVPEENGEYVVEILANWSEGSANYAFAFSVE